MTRIVFVALAACILTLSGCATGSPSVPHGPSPAANAAARRLLAHPLSAVPASPPTGSPASPAAVSVIRAWSSALRTGRVRLAASYFSLPSELINGAGPGGTVAVVRIGTVTEAEAANATLPCGAKFVSADQRGRYVNALFRLTGRGGPGGGSCAGGAGQTARTDFLIADGRIIEWIRAPDDPGDNGSPTPGPGSGTSTTPLV